MLIAASAVSSPGEGVLVGVFTAVGALLGEIASYSLGYWIRESARGGRLRRHAGGARISSARRFLMTRGCPAISRQICAGLRMVMPLAVGLSGFSFKRFITWSVPASFAWSAICVTIYALAAAPLRDGSGSLELSFGLALPGFCMCLAAYLLQSHVEKAHRRTTEASRTSNATAVIRRRGGETTRWNKRSFDSPGLTQYPVGVYIAALTPKLKIRVTTVGRWDDIGQVLRNMGVDFESFDGQFDSAILFANCGTSDAVDASCVRSLLRTAAVCTPRTSKRPLCWPRFQNCFAPTPESRVETSRRVSKIQSLQRSSAPRFAFTSTPVDGC